MTNLDRKNVSNEISIHSKLNHANILRMVDYFITRKFIYIVFKYCEKGDLFDWIAKNPKRTPGQTNLFFFQVLKGIRYIHAQQVLLRDIKPENILIDREDTIKICDFGWACSFKDLEYRREQSGTLQYMSPETMRRQLQDYRSDVWSLGVLLYEMHHGREPFKDPKVILGKKSLSRNDLWWRPGIGEETVKLILSMMTIDKERRASLEQVMGNPIFKKYLGFKIVKCQKNA